MSAPGGEAGGIRETPARRVPGVVKVGALLLPLALLLFSCSGCSPVYVARAGWAEMRILTGRRSFDEVLADPSTDAETHRKLLLARQARAFAIHQIGLDAGDSYTSFTQLETDTLAWVLSAAYRDRLESKTWWFPVVGRVPYKGYASQATAEKAERGLQREGFDTYLRPTSAFSTLGWFADPLLSSVLRYDDIELVTTILHELSHNHLFLPGEVRFNESFATFVGRTAAIRFFCGPEGSPTGDTERCALAGARWEDYLAFSVFLDDFVEGLQEIYARTDLTSDEKVQAREELFQATGSNATSTSPMVRGFLSRPLNNATLLGRIRYFHRLPGFQALLDEEGGNLSVAIARIAREAERAPNPFQILPPTEPNASSR